MFFSRLFLLIAALYADFASAIVNIENMRNTSDDKVEGFESKLSLEVSGNNGNTQKIKAGLGGRAQWYEEDGTRFVVLNYEYGESASIKDTDKTFLHFRNIWYRDKQWAWEMFTQVQNNEFTRLTLRALLGAGFRLRVSHGDDHNTYLGLGMFRSKEKLELVLPATDAGVTYTNRVNFYLVHKYKISSHSRLVNTLYYQPDIDEVSDYRLFEQFILQLDITEDLSLKVSLDVSHDSLPPQLIRKTDTSYYTGFEYRF